MSIFGRIGQIWDEITKARQRRKLGITALGGASAYRRTTWLENMAELDSLIERTGHTGSASQIRAVARPCLHLFEAGTGESAPLGETRFGGVPDLPVGSDWPRDPEGAPLRFYAQIALRELDRTAIAEALPETGMLSFFAGDLQTESIPVKVMLTPQGIELGRHRSPADHDPDIGTLNPVSARFEPGLSFPDFDANWTEAIEHDNPDGDLDALNEGFLPPFPVLGQLLGYAPWSQDDLRAQLHFSDIGRPGQERLLIFQNWADWEQGKAIESRLRGGMIYRPWSARDDDNVRWILDHREAITDGVNRWRSLLTIESNKAMNLWINDANAIYFFIDRDDLRAGDFTRVRALTTQN